MVLVDRFTEMEAMQALLDRLKKSASGVLVLRGQAGIGKTALLRELVQGAVGAEMQVAQALGIQSEMEFDFAGLHQLLLPFVGGLERLPGPQRAALGTVFGLTTGQATDRSRPPVTRSHWSSWAASCPKGVACRRRYRASRSGWASVWSCCTWTG